MTETGSRLMEEIIADYGDVLSERSALGDVVRDVRSLPYTKKTIKRALLSAIRGAGDPATKERLKSAYVLLADFQRLTDIEVYALQVWNNETARGSRSGNVDRDRLERILAERDVAIAVHKRVSDEAGGLLEELNAAGF
jgi:hypothetical protein